MILLTLIPITLFVLYRWLQGPAYIVRGKWLLYPTGKPVAEYDGNDRHHFPKWRPYVPDQGNRS